MVLEPPAILSTTVPSRLALVAVPEMVITRLAVLLYSIICDAGEMEHVGNDGGGAVNDA